MLVFDPGVRVAGIDVRWESIALAAVVLLALALWVRALGTGGGAPSWMDIGLVLGAAAVGAIVGGRLVHVLDFLDAYAADPVAAVDLGRGSASLVGAVLGGIVAGGCAGMLLGVPAGAWGDAAAVPLLVAIGGGKLAQLLGGAGLGAPWDGAWSIAYGGEGPWRSVEPWIAAWPSQALEGGWTLLGIPIVLLADSRMAGGPNTGRGLLLLSAVAWWLAGRAVIAMTWRDAPALGPIGPEGLATILALALVALAALLILRHPPRAAAPA
ncbi:MAG: prolipoprotein diacylglyceryl transferase family protein [Candidatus Limnocylindrales bacterium]